MKRTSFLVVIQQVHSKGDESWVFFGRNDAKAETPILWPPNAKSWLIGKDSDAGRDWGQEEKGMTEDEMAGWHRRLDGREFEWTPGVGDGQGGLTCCDSWGCKELDMTEQLNWIELTWNQGLERLRTYPVSGRIFFFFFCFSSRLVGSKFPNQGLNQILLEWKCRVLTTGPPWKSQVLWFGFLKQPPMRCPHAFF